MNTTKNARTRALALGIILGLPALTSLTGCGQSPAQASTPVALAVVISPHANAPKPSITESMMGALQQAVAGDGYISVVINDGEPKLIDGGGAKVGSDARTERMREEANSQQVESLKVLITAQKASAKENAPLQALMLAARDLSGHAGQRRILIQDSGLQTVDPVSFVPDGQLASDPKDVADFLAAKHELPDLKGIDIVWSGLGDTAAPQQALDQATRTNLQAIWQAILEKAGATVAFDQTPTTGKPANGLPVVTPVPLPKPVQLPTACAPREVFLTNSDVRFVGDKAIYAYELAAEQTLRPIAQRIVDGGLKVRLIGTTASGPSKAFIQQLSENRAAKVRETLISFGVDPSAISAEGQGMSDKWHVLDRDAAGDLIPNLAAKNRKVVVIISGQTGCLDGDRQR